MGKLILLGGMGIVAALSIGLLLLAVAGLGLILALPLLGFALIAGAFVLWVWMLVDVIRNDQLSGWARLGWAVAIWFTHWIGALVYFFVARRGRFVPHQRISA